MHERLKRIIFKKLDQDLGHAEIIVDDNKSIWFIDRANKYWYLELRSSGTLWWRYTFFNDFFPLFGMVREEYEPVIAEWVEEVLKHGVSSTFERGFNRSDLVEEVLNRGVSSTLSGFPLMDVGVEEVLKREVYSTQCNVGLQGSRPVEEVLESKASPTTVDNLSAVVTMKKVLSLKAGVRECKMKIKKIFKKIIT
jgi:hypothetical protein